MHGHDHGQEGDFRPKSDRVEREDTDLSMKAAVAGRTDVLGQGGMLGLQRAIGNSGVNTMMEQEKSPVLDVVNGGGGSALDNDTRTDMESRFGTSFGDVRVHTGGTAHDSAKSVNAQAYTVGPNIVFQDGKYDPGSDSGKHMIAHELTHVVQQRSGPVDGSDAGGGVKVSDPSDRFEREASANADRLMSSDSHAGHSHDAAPAAAGVQRIEEPGVQRIEESAVQRVDDPSVQREEGEDEEPAEVQGYVQREEEAGEEEEVAS
ncbi:DUF4157 domain-containing protein [Actinoplanes sp. NBRC 103695]|uniref:eCIS core domain-containing protein n=1 Tax=Actinoplanes sp. NBRC 103695 TaxID=3032202 RepID=UPI0025534F5F|nr:DUF4157 domain-containing protein [Actinoplanes sp. NBRC 103695]